MTPGGGKDRGRVDVSSGRRPLLFYETKTRGEVKDGRSVPEVDVC